MLLYHLDMLKVARAASSIRIPVCDRAEGLFCDSMHPEGRKECEAALREPLASQEAESRVLPAAHSAEGAPGAPYISGRIKPGAVLRGL